MPITPITDEQKRALNNILDVLRERLGHWSPDIDLGFIIKDLQDNSGIPDPIVPADGSQGIVGDLHITGRIKNTDNEALILESSVANGAVDGGGFSIPAFELKTAALITDPSQSLFTLRNGNTKVLYLNKRGSLEFYGGTDFGDSVIRSYIEANGSQIEIAAIDPSGSAKMRGDILSFIRNADGLAFAEANRHWVFKKAVGFPIAVKTAAYTATAADHTLLVNATTAGVTITLPDSIDASIAENQVYVIKKIDVSANTVVVDGSGAQTIDGAATKTLGSQWASLMIQNRGDGSWVILSQMGTIS